MESNNFIVLNGRTRSDSSGQFTFSNKNGQSTVDLIWVDMVGVQHVKIMLVDTIWSTSDHFPITVELFLQTTHANEHFQHRINCRLLRWNTRNSEAYSHELLWSPLIAADFSSEQTDQLNSKLIQAITSAADNCNMLIPINTKKKRPHKPWFDKECNSARLRVNACLKLCKTTPRDKNVWDSYHDTKSVYQVLLAEKKSSYIKSLHLKFTNTRNSSEFWSVIRSTRRTVYRPPQISLDEWVKFFQEVYSPRLEYPLLLTALSDDALDAEITIDELLKCLNKAKQNKAAGTDRVTNEFLKSLPHNWLLYLVSFFNKVFSTGEAPSSWSEIITCMLHKKGDFSDPSNYRGIALVNCVTKIFTQILHDRINQWAERNTIIPEEQAGFRQGRGCADNVFSLQSLLQIQTLFKGVSSYALFIDFKRAFDSVPYRKLWIKLNRLGLSPKMLKILSNLYKNTSMRVRSGGSLSTQIPITEGVLQGETLSPLLFSLYISDIITFLKDKGSEGFFFDKREVLLLMYADDIVLLASTEIKLRRSLKSLEEYCSINDLTVNSGKTKVLITRSTGRLPRKIKDFTFKGQTLEIVKTYEYLGVNFCTSMQGNAATSDAVKKGKMAASTVLATLSKLRTSAWPGVIKLHSSITRSTMLYLAHVWCLKPENLEQLESANLFFFKRLLQLPACTPNYAFRLELDIDHISVAILNAAINWVIKIVDMDETRLPKNCLKKLLSLTTTPFNSARLNWIQQLKNILSSIGEDSLINNLTATHWKRNKTRIVEKYKNYRRALDVDRYRASTACQFTFEIQSLQCSSAKQALQLLPYHLAKLICQIRLASKYASNITVGKRSLRLFPNKTCPCCHLNTTDSVAHLLALCPAFAEPREKYLAEWYDVELDVYLLNDCLSAWNPQTVKKLFAYCKDCSTIRVHDST